ncbi:ABC transporter permease [Mycetocola zhadangensis]|uniref:ABC transporter permease n=1 Tax=Mycetocola zhadangensis TaxID=1164595 RepID=A0A3L7J1P4_9MICO|nr:ABC transporter permease [Mycetocola zhadangensis]RLQ84466.1 ABC transporter permease [Mycetocola zhadangensis]GGE92757.1 glycine/betaine ABC transporter permease [Mycetocola zhadangensis]
MNLFADAIGWILDPSHWTGPDGIPNRILEHLGYTTITVLIATAIAVTLGLYIGHTGRLRGLVVGVTGALRALPTLGLLVYLAVLFGLGIRFALLPTIIVLVVLAIPPLLAGAYSGVQSVDGRTVDAARSMGMTEWQILWKVEVPLALPLIIGGIRSAVLQVVATATVAAYISLGGLGRYIIDALPVRDYTKVLVGALLVTILALVLDGILIFCQRLTIPAGVRAIQISSRERSTSRSTPAVSSAA